MSAQDYTKWHLPKGVKLRLGKGYINEIVYSPDSSRLAVASSIGIWIYDAETGEELDLFTGHTGPVERLSYSPDGRFIASSSADKSARLWDAVTGEQKAILNHNNNVSGFVYSPDGSTIATENYNGVYLWDAVTGEHKATLTEHVNSSYVNSCWVSNFAYSPDGNTIATKHLNYEVRLWDAATGKHKTTLTAAIGKRVYFGEQKAVFIEHTNVGKIFASYSLGFGYYSRISRLAYSPDGNTIAAINNEQVYLWDVATGEHKATLAEYAGIGKLLVYSPDGNTIATGAEHHNDRTVRIWDAVTGKRRAVLRHTHCVKSFTYSPDGSTIATISADNNVRVWDVATGKQKAILTKHAYIYGILAYSPDGNTIATGSYEEMRVWDAATGKQKATLTHTHRIKGFTYSLDGNTIATKNDHDEVYLWDSVTGERKVILAHTHCVEAFAYSPDGTTIATKHDHNEVYLWDSVTGERKAILTHTHCVEDFAYSPDGTTIATRDLNERWLERKLFNTGDSEEGDWDAAPKVWLWDAVTGEHKATLTCTGGVMCFTYSPDGTTIATGNYKEVRLWDTNTGKHKTMLTGHTGSIKITYGPDGSMIAAKSSDLNVWLWDAVTGKYKATYTWTEGVMSFVYNSNGHTITIKDDKFMQLWDTVLGEYKATLSLASCILQDAVYNADGSIYASISGGYRDHAYNVCLYDSATQECKVTLACTGSAKSFVYSPDGTTIVIESEEGDSFYYLQTYVELWDAITGEHKATLTEHDPSVDFESLVYSPNSRVFAATVQVLAATVQEEVHLWDAVTGKYITTLAGHTDVINGICFSSDSKTVASVSKDGTVLLREIPSDQHPDINPQEIHGNWRAGWALDTHTLSSRPLPGGRYDTNRTEFGEWVFQLKYRHDRTKIQPIAEVAANFIREKFAVDGHPILPYLKAVLPIPPSDQNRDFQPVTEVAQEIGGLLNVPVRTDYLRKVKQTTPLKNLSDVESKREQLRGAFVVESQDLKNQCVLLVDDLYDSGTTLTEVSKVLYEQGSVQHVLVLTLTRTRTGGN